MKDFLNYLLTIPKRIGIYFAKRRALRDHRAAIEHARKVELAQKTIELVQATAAGMVAMMDARARLEAAKRTKFPPGGMAAPEVDSREWFTSERVKRNVERIRKATEHRKAADTQRPTKEQFGWTEETGWPSAESRSNYESAGERWLQDLKESPPE